MSSQDVAYLAAIVFISITINFIAWFYLFTKLEYIESFFEKSKWIVDNKCSPGITFASKANRLHVISTVLWMEKRLHRRGLVDLEEVRRFPRKLRCQIQTIYAVNYINFCGMFLVWILGKYV